LVRTLKSPGMNRVALPVQSSSPPPTLLAGVVVNRRCAAEAFPERMVTGSCLTRSSNSCRVPARNESL